MTQIPYRMPRELVDFVVANSAATNEAQEILAGMEGRSPEGLITKESLKTIATLADLCALITDSINVIEAIILLSGEGSPLPADLCRRMLIEHSAIPRRLILEITDVYTAHERN